MDGQPVIRAAGGVLRSHSRVAVVHRPKYDDWTLPKGKLEAGEDERAGALREVAEETGHRARIESDLGTVEYAVRRGGELLPKVVRYFLMRELGGEFRPHREVDELRWLSPAEAMELLSYRRDREVLARAADVA